ncbi:hypothetical protein ACIP98_41030 [Streptomyces sp. NPDC088354]|uniref:hypothetical protein n=1 Tax=Streptomyces sp. NPDC088354 TaxID=3365856 RepID=UPI0038102DA3
MLRDLVVRSVLGVLKAVGCAYWYLWRRRTYVPYHDVRNIEYHGVTRHGETPQGTPLPRPSGPGDGGRRTPPEPDGDGLRPAGSGRSAG